MSEISNESLEEARRYVRRKRIFYSVVGIWLALSPGQVEKYLRHIWTDPDA